MAVSFCWKLHRGSNFFGSVKSRICYSTEEKLEAERIMAEEKLEAERIMAEEKLEAMGIILEDGMSAVERLEIENERINAERREAERIEQEKRIEEQNLKREAERLEAEKLREKERFCNDKNRKDALEELLSFIPKFHQLCKTAQHGSYNDFVKFYSAMQYIKNQLANSPQETNEYTWKIFNLLENNCQDTEIHETVIDGKNEHIAMSMCFEEVYEKFGEFPAMELGISPDYFDHNPQHTTNNSQCSIFCDIYGYEPQWAKSMGGHIKQLQRALQS